MAKKQQSDERFASERARVLSRKYGPAKIRQDLKARGITDDIIDRMHSPGEEERAAEILKRKYHEPAASREERARRARFLQGRGFSYEAIRKALSLSDSE